MKRLFTLLLAAAMIVSVVSIDAFAAVDVDYPVSHIWKYGFLIDEDDDLLDLNNRVYEVPYGETIYFPLINTNAEDYSSSDLAAKKAAYEKAEEELSAAQKAYDNATTAQTAAQSALDNAKKELDAAKKALEDAGNSSSALAGKFDDAITDAEALAAAKTDKKEAEEKLASIEDLLTSWGDRVSTLNTYTEEYITNALNSYYDEGADEAAKQNAVNLVSFLNTVNGTTLAFGTAPLDTAENAIPAIKTAVTNANTLCTTKIGTAEDAANQSGSLNAQKKYWTNEKTDAEGEITSKSASLKTKLTELKASVSAINAEETDPDVIREWKTQYGGSSDTSALEQAVTNAQKKVDEKQDALDDAKSAVETRSTELSAAKTKRDNAKAAYETAGGKTDGYVFVYEADAVNNTKIKTDWDVGKKYIDSVKLVRVKAKSSTYGLGTTYTSSKRNIYCIAVKMEKSSSTGEQEVEGEIGISKSGSVGFSYSDTAISVSLTLSFPTAKAGEQDIPTTPLLFKDGYGFEADSDYTFYFEDDEDSYFEVSTANQKSIVLAFDRDYDDDIADMIYKKYPTADLEFYNGNYARFSKTGTLYLSYPEDDAYVYEISSDGDLSRVDADYDEYDETYSFRTNTLGRYVISSRKLSSVIGGSSSSSSTSTTPSSSVSKAPSTSTGSTTTSKSSTTTPASSKPASSTSTKPSSSSVPSSSSELEESSEPLSIKESSSEEEEDFESVIVNTDDEEDDVPKKKGVSWLVWLLIIAGLAAVLVAVGVIFYTRKNSGRRML